MTAKRLTEREKGYGTPHRRLRRQLAPIVATGTVRCARCGELIGARERWDLGHLDGGAPDEYQGPEHVRCSRATVSHARAAAAAAARDPYAEHPAEFPRPRVARGVGTGDGRARLLDALSARLDDLRKRLDRVDKLPRAWDPDPTL
jgi:hypothetical protein